MSKVYLRHIPYWWLDKEQILLILPKYSAATQKIKLIIIRKQLSFLKPQTFFLNQQILSNKPLDNKIYTVKIRLYLKQLIILMQAIVATSRSISQDKFLQRQKKLKYDKHLETVDNITKQKTHPLIAYARQTQKMSQTLYKAKETAKNFKDESEKTQIKKQNRRVLQKIWKIESNIKFDTMQHLQHVSGSNWNFKKKQQESIKEENKRFVMSILSKKNEVEDYKKKMKHQVKQYLELREQIRKCKYKSPKSKKSLPRSQSERKAVHLVLHKVEQPQKLEKVKRDEKNSITQNK